MPRSRRTLPVDVKRHVLHTGGYRCGNPVCRGILTLDIHRIEYVGDGGSDDPDNLLALCPNCHAQHHSGVIPVGSIRTWKQVLIALNDGVDRRAVDQLLTLTKTNMFVSGDGVLECAGLIATGLAHSTLLVSPNAAKPVAVYTITLTDRGRKFIEAWATGDQRAALDTENDRRGPSATNRSGQRLR